MGVLARDERDTGTPAIGPVHDIGAGDTVAGETAALGGIAGFAVGVLALAIPGVGPILAAGPLAAGLAGAGIGAAAGGLIGYFKDIGISEEEAAMYAEGIRRGGAIVTIQCEDDQADGVTGVLKDSGATDINKHAEEWRAAGWTGFDASAQPMPRTRRA
jgi:hypothetical protein